MYCLAVIQFKDICISWKAGPHHGKFVSGPLFFKFSEFLMENKQKQKPHCSRMRKIICFLSDPGQLFCGFFYLLAYCLYQTT